MLFPLNQRYIFANWQYCQRILCDHPVVDLLLDHSQARSPTEHGWMFSNARRLLRVFYIGNILVDPPQVVIIIHY